MSYNHSRSDKNDAQNRKTGRSGSFNQQRGSAVAYGRGSGGPAPSPSISSGRNYTKKSNNNAQVAQPRAPNVPIVNSSPESFASAPRGGQNGAHVQPQFHGVPDTPVTAAKQGEPSAAAPTRSRGVPKAPTIQSATMSAGASAPPASTPSKAPGDGAKPILQFGSISPGFVNGMQIPARTNSAPPNLDEQKRNQARQDSFRPAPAPAPAHAPAPAPAPAPVPVPPLPTPGPKQQVPRNNQGPIVHPILPETHPIPKHKKDVVQVSPAPVPQSQKPSGHPISGISMPIQFHGYGGHSQQIQPQGVAPGPLQMPMQMPLSMGSGPGVQQTMFVPGLQPHPMQHQGIIHQGQNLSFTAQMAQLPNQLGNMGIGIGPSQYPPQQGGKFAPPQPRKTPVKITNPKTHEEVRFDKRTDVYGDGVSSGIRTHPNVPPQSQTIPPQFAASHPVNFYTAPYGNNVYYNPNSHPLTSGPMPQNSQVARYNYPGSHGSQNVKIVNPSTLNNLPLSNPGGPMHGGILEPPNLEHARDFQSSTATHVTVKPPAGSREKVESVSNNLTTAEKVELPKPLGLSAPVSSSHAARDDESSQQSQAGGDSSVSDLLPVVPAIPVHIKISPSLSSSTVLSESVPVVGNGESRKKESLSRSNSIKDQKKPVKKGSSQNQPQVDDQSVTAPSLPLQSSSENVVAESVDHKTSFTQLINEDVPKTTAEFISDTTTEALITKRVSESEDCRVLSVAYDTSLSLQNSSLDDASLLDSQLQCTASWTEEEGKESSEGINEGRISKSEGPSDPDSSLAVDDDEQSTKELPAEEISTSIVIPLPEAISLDDSEESCFTPNDETVDDKVRVEDSSGLKSLNTEEVCAPKPESGDTDSSAVKELSSEDVSGSAAPSAPTGSKDKPIPELTRSKSSISRGKKKRKEFLQKADAAGTTSDLYMAYKSPEEKKEALLASEAAESSSSATDSKELVADSNAEEIPAIENDTSEDKAEPEDWEDAADSSKPKLESENDIEQALGGDQDMENMVKKYSRDFLLKFADQCTEIPANFEIAADIAEALMSSGGNRSSPYPSPGRGPDRQIPTRLDRRNSGLTEDDRWNKFPSHFPSSSGRIDVRSDLSFVLSNNSNPNFRPGPVGNIGVLKYPRVPSPGQYAGGILSASPIQSIGPHGGGLQRNSSDADRWQRATSFQHRGLIPSPQTPFVTMHKSENRYEVGKVSDEEEAKQRQLKAILNKLTPQNFDRLFEQVKAVNIDNAGTLRGVIGQIFDKALMEPTFCEMYANFCLHLSGELKDFVEGEVKVTFKRLLLNKCQEEFERGEREQLEANKADEEGQVKQSKEEREEKRVKARRRMLGNIRLIGELFKKKMLTEKIMHSCIQKLLGQHETPDEEDIEALCKLMSTIGESIDHVKAKVHMDSYFDSMRNLSDNMKLSSRVRFMLKDAIDLRKNSWQERRKVDGPKKIEEVHRDAAQERQAQTSRLSRGPSLNTAGRRGGQAIDFGSRGSNPLPSPISQMPASYRPLPSQPRVSSSQDIRSQRSGAGEDAITLGPQGGLARGMSSRGLVPTGEMSPGIGVDLRRFAPAVLNGYGSVPDRGYSPREDQVPRFAPERLTGQGGYDQMSPGGPERNIYVGGRESRTQDQGGGADRSLLSSPPSRGPAQSAPAEKVLSEEELQKKSRTAIKEYYSARDIKELSLCIKELNSPSFYPAMVSLWVTDSFEAKDMERDLLAKLLVNLSTSSDSSLSPSHLVKGFENVLETLEDFRYDAPKAPSYLGRIFAKVVTEQVVELKDIGQIILSGGDEPGSLLKSGLAGDVLGATLDVIKSEKGDQALVELIKGASLRPETFRPPAPHKSKALEDFILGS